MKGRCPDSGCNSFPMSTDHWVVPIHTIRLPPCSFLHNCTVLCSRSMNRADFRLHHTRHVSWYHSKPALRLSWNSRCPNATYPTQTRNFPSGCWVKGVNFRRDGNFRRCSNGRHSHNSVVIDKKSSDRLGWQTWNCSIRRHYPVLSVYHWAVWTFHPKRGLSDSFLFHKPPIHRDDVCGRKYAHSSVRSMRSVCRIQWSLWLSGRRFRF